MTRTAAQRGTFGSWLKDVREQRYRTQAEALSAMRRLAGLVISPSEFAQWEAGSRVPRQDNPKVARLYEFFGSQPQPELEPATSDVVALVATVRELIEELRDERAARVQWERDFLEAWQELATGATPRDAPASAPRDAVPQ